MENVRSLLEENNKLLKQILTAINQLGNSKNEISLLPNSPNLVNKKSRGRPVGFKNKKTLMNKMNGFENNKLSEKQAVDLFFSSPLLLKNLAKQYQEHPDILMQKDAKIEVRNNNLFISSNQGNINLNLSEKNIHSSFINKIYSKDNNSIFVQFKSGKTYKYSLNNNNKSEFFNVRDNLLTTSYVSGPFLRLLRNNNNFNYEVVKSF